VNHWKVVPDILTTAKGVTSAYVPLGVTATSAEITKFFDDNLFPHGHTYEAHRLTLAPAIAAINEYRRLNLIERSRTLGATLGQKLKTMAERHKSVGEVRGKGLFWALELVKNQKTRQPFNTVQEKYEGKAMEVDKVTGAMLAQGVFAMSWVSHIILAPPLIISEAELDEGLAALDKALELTDAQVTG
jgi:taurine--2-oxoglutarate transaminase